MADDGGVLGNLPNERPGRRSAKREKGAASAGSGGRPAKTAGKAATKAETAGKRAAAPPRTKPKAAAPPPPPPPEAAERSPDLVSTAVRTAAGVAGAGLRVTTAVGRELWRRLPRP
jgi:hypothetical protein